MVIEVPPSYMLQFINKSVICKDTNSNANDGVPKIFLKKYLMKRKKKNNFDDHYHSRFSVAERLGAKNAERNIEFTVAIHGYHFYKIYCQPKEAKRLASLHKVDNPSMSLQSKQ